MSARSPEAVPGVGSRSDVATNSRDAQCRMMPSAACRRSRTVRAAAGRIAGHARRTPLLTDTPLDALTGGRILLKLADAAAHGVVQSSGEPTTGSYSSTPAQRRAGVVAFSSGNHAQGVAAAARLLGNTIHDRDAVGCPTGEAAEHARTGSIGRRIRSRAREPRRDSRTPGERSAAAVLVPSFDDPHIIAGQGTVRARDCRAGGGDRHPSGRRRRVLQRGRARGRHGGSAVTAHAAVVARLVAEPAAFDDYRRSLRSGERLRQCSPAPRSICDALQAPTPGELTFRSTTAAGRRPRGDRRRGARCHCLCRASAEAGGRAGRRRCAGERNGRPASRLADEASPSCCPAATSTTRCCENACWSRLYPRPAMFDLHAWLIALATLFTAGALTWLVSVAQRNVTIVDSLWPVLFMLAALAYAASVPSQGHARRSSSCSSRSGACGSAAT